MSITKTTCRFLSITCMIFVMLYATFSASAIEIGSNNSGIINTPDELSSKASVGQVVSGTVGINSVINLYPYLEQGNIFGRTLCIRTSSSSTSGAVFLYLYSPNGDLVSDDWIMGVSDESNEYMFLPSYGRYTLKVIAQGNNQPVNVDAWWQ